MHTNAMKPLLPITKICSSMQTREILVSNIKFSSPSYLKGKGCIFIAPQCTHLTRENSSGSFSIKIGGRGAKFAEYFRHSWVSFGYMCCFIRKLRLWQKSGFLIKKQVFSLWPITFANNSMAAWRALCFTFPPQYLPVEHRLNTNVLLRSWPSELMTDFRINLYRM